MIQEIIKEKWNEGILVVVATIEAAEELGRKTEEWIGGVSSFHRPKLMVLHSDTNRITEMEDYKDSPLSLADYDILVITSARIIIEPYELFISYKTVKRGFMLIDEMITAGHARAILAVSDMEKQESLAMRVFDEKLSVRETEKLVKHIVEPPKKTQKTVNTAEDAIYESLEEKMKGIVGTRVFIHRKKNNKGKIEIEYYSRDELERIIELFESIR